MAGNPSHSGRQWRNLRNAILKQSDICWLCGQPGADTVDHVIELKRGGTNDPTNLRPAHGKRRPDCPGNYARSAGLRRATPRRRNTGQATEVSRPWT